MIVVTVIYDGEIYVSKKLDETLENIFYSITSADTYVNFPLADNRNMLLKSEAIKRAVFLVEEVQE